MYISSDKLQNLPVVTEMGNNIGHVKRWDIDVESHEIARYYVKPSGLVQMLSSEELVIAPAQVIGITEEKMTVRDAVETEFVSRPKKRRVLAEDVSPAMTRENS